MYKRQINSLNLQTDTEYLRHVYVSILQKLKIALLVLKIFIILIFYFIVVTFNFLLFYYCNPCWYLDWSFHVEEITWDYFELFYFFILYSYWRWLEM